MTATASCSLSWVPAETLAFIIPPGELAIMLVITGLFGILLFYRIVRLKHRLTQVCSGCQKRSMQGATFCPKCGNSFSGEPEHSDSETLVADTAEPSEDPPPTPEGD